jgi:predicted membrane protein
MTPLAFFVVATCLAACLIWPLVEAIYDAQRVPEERTRRTLLAFVVAAVILVSVVLYQVWIANGVGTAFAR